MAGQGTARAMSAHEISHAVIKCALKVHSALGPGLLESTYEACLAHELGSAGFKVETQVGLPVVYDGVKLEIGYRVDMMVNDLVIVELKSVEEISRTYRSSDFVSEAQQEEAGLNHQFQRFTPQGWHQATGRGNWMEMTFVFLRVLCG